MKFSVTDTIKMAFEAKVLPACRECPLGLLVLADVERLVKSMDPCPIVANSTIENLFKL